MFESPCIDVSSSNGLEVVCIEHHKPEPKYVGSSGSSCSFIDHRSAVVCTS